jgi:hypothetical protein
VDWVSGVLSIGCLAVVLLHLVRLVLPAGATPGDRIGEVSHAVMALGMAAMFSPLGNPLPAPVWTVTYLLCGAWFAAVALRTPAPGGDATHHVVGSAAMLFMLIQHDPAAAGAPAAAGHAAHGGGGGGLGLVSLAAILLAGYFAWHALRCTDRLRAGTSVVAEAGGVAIARRVRPVSVRSSQVVALAHVVMAVAMTVMLLAMV